MKYFCTIWTQVPLECYTETVPLVFVLRTTIKRVFFWSYLSLVPPQKKKKKHDTPGQSNVMLSMFSFQCEVDEVNVHSHRCSCVCGWWTGSSVTWNQRCASSRNHWWHWMSKQVRFYSLHYGNICHHEPFFTNVNCMCRNKENHLKSQQLQNLLPSDVTSNKDVTAVWDRIQQPP